ncbi:hypothetical protein M438DRAFT_341780 [Aureobasidium pullulans EXF-150]|uniref:Uncharacterized protein n=1 Tax=Aureobasidium pullulans EXF-150 TaxID=1043002 RepID=A0A074Y2F3_AURPU|nr:uncharacterized protein M438DRAFT_341780 [Aureobasidium pullulans EXF-150]KEQ90089.1 hypothetical protein M438DRAFT_341780 [Aureobasidium pullulans EXF-150]
MTLGASILSKRLEVVISVPSLPLSLFIRIQRPIESTTVAIFSSSSFFLLIRSILALLHLLQPLLIHSILPLPPSNSVHDTLHPNPQIHHQVHLEHASLAQTSAFFFMLELVADVRCDVFLDTLDVFGVEGLVELDVLVAVEDCVFEGGEFVVGGFFGGLDLGLSDGACAGDGLFALGAVVVFGSGR